MQDLDAGGRELSGEIGALHSRITRLEQVSHELVNQKNVDEELDLAWREWESTFDAAKDSIVLTDSEFKIIQANRAASRLFAKPLDQIVGKTCWQLVHETDYPSRDCPLEKAKTTKKHEEIELHLPQNGIWVADSVDPVFDQQGNLSGAVHIIRDVTDRKQAERLLRKERDRSQKYLDVAGVMLVAIDAEQRVGLINKKGCEILGYSEEEVIAKNWFDNFLPESIREQVRTVFEKIVSGELDSLEYYENPILTKNGQERLIAWHNTVLRDDKGHVIATLSSGEDITERKKAEEALHFARFALDHAVDTMVCISQDARHIDVNDAFCRAVGYSREELLSMTVHDIDPNYSAKIWPEFWEKLKQSGSLTFESCHRRKDGTVFPIEGTVTFFKYKGKEYHCGFARDITERKKMEQELREKEKKWTSLTENTNDIIMIVDNKGKLQYINKTIPPYTPKATVGKSVYEYVPKEQHDTIRNSLTNVFKTGKPETYEVSSVIPKLGTLWFSTKVVPIKIEENVVNAILISTDITERKKAEEALRESEEKYRDLFENAREAILTLDLKGNITGVNKLVEEYGFKREDLIGKSHFDFIAEKSRDKAFKEFERLTQGTPVEGEVEVITPKGNRIVEYRNNPIRRGGQIVGVQEILIDITERKKAEQQLLNDQAQLKSLASELTLAEEHERRRLATDLHDRISQALVISKIKLDALRKTGRSRKLDKALEDVCDSIGQTIQDTRTLTFDLSSPVLYELGFETAVSEWLTDQIQKKHGLAVEFEDDKLPKPLDDDIRIFLFRDVRELLINVVKHAHAHKVKVSVRKLDNHICVTVEDDGVGFDPADVISMAAKRGEFGLFSIRERLEDLEGHLQIDSAPGRGCKVTITAPLKQKEVTR